MLQTRIATAAVLVAALLAALYLATPLQWLVLCAAATAVAGWEWGRLSGISSLNSAFYGAALAIFSGGVGLYHDGDGAVTVLIASIAFWVLVAPRWLSDRAAMRGMAKLLWAGSLVLPATCLALIKLHGKGPGVLLGVMAIVWISDTVAYFVGRQFGKRKLAPRISPGKTWEGAWGAFAAVAIFAVLWWLLSPESLPQWLQSSSLAPLPIVGLWVLLAAGGIAGDLLESQLKRIAGVKDSSKLLPGHGGLLDRADALTAALPFAACLYLIR